MKFLSNLDSKNHQAVLLENLKAFQEAFFAVAFLKESGLNKILLALKTFIRNGGQISIIAGQNFALTEPEALHTLRKLFKNYPNCKLYLAKANVKERVFHPKIYLFKSKGNCSVISGSANITQGGLVNNLEASILVFCKDSEDIWINAKDYFDSLVSPENADEASLLVIKQYETFFEQQKQNNQKVKAIPTRRKSQIEFDYTNLFKHFQNFDNKKRQDNLERKLREYTEAKKILDTICNSKKFTQREFEPLLDELVGSKNVYNLWHSGSLFRLRKKVYPYYKEFRELVRYIRDNKSSSPSLVFENAKERVNIIKGAAVNYITEIMMTYNSRDFANINRNPITVLKEEGGVNIKGHSSQFSPSDYEEYCELVKEISHKLGLKNMLEADSFFNEIYWKIR